MRLLLSGSGLLAASLLASCNGAADAGVVPDARAARKIVCDELARAKPSEAPSDWCPEMTAKLYAGIWYVTVPLPKAKGDTGSAAIILKVSQKDGKLSDGAILETFTAKR